MRRNPFRYWQHRSRRRRWEVRRATQIKSLTDYPLHLDDLWTMRWLPEVLALDTTHPSQRSIESPVFLFAAGWRSGSTFLQRQFLSAGYEIWGEPYHSADLLPDLMLQWFETHFRTDVEPGTVLAEGSLAPQRRANNWVAITNPGPTRLAAAQAGMLTTLFGASGRWGLKEIRLGGHYSVLLRHLFPRSRFVHLIRDPYSAYRSYHSWTLHNQGWQLTNSAARVHTADRFVRHWGATAGSFLRSDLTDAHVLYYEELSEPATRGLLFEQFGIDEAAVANLQSVRGSPHPPTTTLNDAEVATIREEVTRVGLSDRYPGPIS